VKKDQSLHLLQIRLQSYDLELHRTVYWQTLCQVTRSGKKFLKNHVDSAIHKYYQKQDVSATSSLLTRTFAYPTLYCDLFLQCKQSMASRYEDHQHYDASATSRVSNRKNCISYSSLLSLHVSRVKTTCLWLDYFKTVT
jgi:hypothetical protein